MISDISRMLRREFDSRARSIGITRPQWRVLMLLSRAEGINQGTLAERLEVEPITASRMVDRMEEAGLVERRPDPDDRRAWRLFLTEASRGLLGKLRHFGDEVIGEVFEGFSPTEQSQFVHYLERLRANLSRQGQEGLIANG